ncbi:MAG: hypothetical protein AAF799_20250 [Myxococcota bacterium]
MTIELADQPVFKLGIDAGSCRFEVRLNDVPILASDVALPYDVEFPVSEWIVHGPNRLAAVVEPPPVFDDDGEELEALERFEPKQSALRLTLSVKRNGAPADQRQTMTTLEFAARTGVARRDDVERAIESSAEGGRLDSTRGFVRDDAQWDVIVSGVDFEVDDEPPHGVFMRRDIGMASPFPQWAWLGGESITDDDATRIALLAEYRRVWGLLQARNVAAVEQLFSLKATEYRAAYYLDDDQLRDALPVVDLMQADELTLQPFETDVELEVFGDGRLARLVDDEGDSPILMLSADGVAYYVGLTYCRIDGRWQLVR